MLKESLESRYLITNPEWLTRVLDVISSETPTTSSALTAKFESVFGEKLIFWTRDELKMALQKLTIITADDDFNGLVAYLIELNILHDLADSNLLIPTFQLKSEYEQKLV